MEAFCKLTEATTENGYLDRLILTYLHQNNPLEILEGVVEQDTPGIFLTRIGWGQQKDYIEETLNAYLSDSLPAVVYAFTPNDSFKYRKTGSRADNEGISSSRDSGSTFGDALKDIMEHVDASVSSGKEYIGHALFFDRFSRDKFERELKRKLKEKSAVLPKKESEKKEISYLVEPQRLNVPNYGTVALHMYTIKLHTRPDK